ncbi:hypothetical protein HO133_006990 [Letharia lupina]|uniref:FAD dependent oxidoreductase domain-containing protein n=1 Tax=Letharia lupina TaxID=560253 RepID=A0A8H6CT72_9LECA|nr:uncharacterized protein HO133_006990 [Letharia lupina]KAF6228879.1 hypothetical protein HO133_006990 [Letharia lupina]
MQIFAVFLTLVSGYVALLAQERASDEQMTLKVPSSEPKNIVIIGGGIIGCSTAYFLTRHAYYNPEIHSIVILEASRIAGGSSGKAGGLLADWATPKCLAPLSFKTHAALAKKHGGDKIWGHRSVYCADVELQAQDVGCKVEAANFAKKDVIAQSSKVPSELDWLLPGSIKSYKELGTPSNSGQVNPYMFTKTLAELAEDKGAKIIIGSATALNYAEDNRSIASVQYSRNGTIQSLGATDILLSAGPWTPRLFPRVHLETPRGHSVVIKPSRNLSPYVLFPNITATPNGSLEHILSPEIYPRPGDRLHGFDSVYACGPDDYDVPLPDTSESVAVDDQSCNDVWTAVKSISREIFDGKLITKQACYKPQIRTHEEGEEVGPMVGPTGIEGLWLATGHDEWGIQNGPGTGLVMSEMMFEGAAKSANCDSLDPKHFLKID